MNHKSTTSLQLLAVLTAMMATACCFPTGAPAFICKSLRPQHLGSALTQEKELSPYSVSAGDSTLAPGASTVVTISSKSTDTADAFKGFLCSASLLDDEKNNTVGKMTTMQDHTKTVDCVKSTPATGITHDNGKVNKWEVKFRWTAPEDASTNSQYKIRCVVVQSIQKCWNDFQINILISDAAANVNTAENDTFATTISTNETQTEFPGASANPGSSDASALNVSVTQPMPTGSGLSTEGVAMTTSEATDFFPDIIVTTETPILTSTQNLPLESSTGIGPPGNESIQNESSPANLVTSTPTTSIGPLPVRERNSAVVLGGPGPTDVVVLQSSTNSQQIPNQPQSQIITVLEAQNIVSGGRRGRPNSGSNPDISNIPTTTQIPVVALRQRPTTVSSTRVGNQPQISRGVQNQPQVSRTGNTFQNHQQHISENRQFNNEAPIRRVTNPREPQTRINSREFVDTPRLPTNRNSFVNNQFPSQSIPSNRNNFVNNQLPTQSIQRPAFTPRQSQTSFNTRNTMQPQFTDTRNTFNNFNQNRFPQSVASINMGPRELVLFNVEDLIPFLGTDALARLGFDTRNMVSFNSPNRNTDLATPSSFNPNLSSRFGNTPSRNFDNFGRMNNFVSERPLVRTTQTFIDPNHINRNAINRNNFNSNQQTPNWNNNMNTFQPTNTRNFLNNNNMNTFNTQGFGNNNMNNFQQTNTRSFGNNVNNFQQTNTRNMNSLGSNQGNNQLRFPTRRSRMVDLINSSSSIRLPTFNRNFF